MRSIVTLARREISVLWNNPATYVIFVVFLLISGWFFAGPLFTVGLSALDTFSRPMPLIFTFLMPALTMRVFSEEYRLGTIEPLATLPLRDVDIVLGKYLGVLGLLASLLALTLFYPILLLILGRPDAGAMVGAYAGLLGLGAFFGAIGLWASALSRNQVVAFIIGFLVCFAFFLMTRVADFFPESLAAFIRAFSVESHYEAMSRGVLDFVDVVYWASGTVFFLAATLAVVHARRWR